MPDILIAKENFRNRKRIFGIKAKDRLKHMYVLGRSGGGKSCLLENMAIQDIRNGHGLCFLDPHGDSSERLIKAIPSNRINDVIYFNPSDTEYPISWNPLEYVEDELQRTKVVSGMMKVFEKLFLGDDARSAPQLTHILRHTLLAITETKPSTLLGVKKMLVNEAYRKKIISKIKDHETLEFWTVEFPERIMKRRDDPLASTLNKIGQFLSLFHVRNIIGQPKSSFKLREVMDEQKILICNLSKGKMGEEGSDLLGAFLSALFYTAALERAEIPEDQRTPFFLYIDEFQNFTTSVYAHILSQARKYGLCLILAHQYLSQLMPEVKDAVLGNVGTMIVFRTGADDAEELEKEFEPSFTAYDLMNLPRFCTYMKLCIDWTTCDAFSAETLPPLDLSDTEGNEEKVVRVSRERYCKNRKEVERKINDWAGR